MNEKFEPSLSFNLNKDTDPSEFDVIDLWQWGKDVQKKDNCTRYTETLRVGMRAMKAGDAMNELYSSDDQFKLVDSDGDGYLTITEIDTRLKKNLSAKERKALMFMKVNHDLIENSYNDEWGPENDGVTRKDLKAFPNEVKSGLLDFLETHGPCA